ncbi:MAG: hypothetical protein JJU09_09840 [Rhodobacteraceae bacterium]|nr:hypothetical protein [Paracoccaceae bacterium]MCC5966638.1 hypothetical protein [Natronohydrobacter sp.]
MLPYTYWMRPDPDGNLRRQNEARAADMYQGTRRIVRLGQRAYEMLMRGLRTRSAASTQQPLRADASARARR